MRINQRVSLYQEGLLPTRMVDVSIDHSYRPSGFVSDRLQEFFLPLSCCAHRRVYFYLHAMRFCPLPDSGGLPVHPPVSHERHFYSHIFPDGAILPGLPEGRACHAEPFDDHDGYAFLHDAIPFSHDEFPFDRAAWTAALNPVPASAWMRGRRVPE
jgi:hypothetical protein